MGIEIKRYHKNEVIFREGAKEGWVLSIESGSVGLYSGYGSEDEKLLAELGANRYFGETGLLETLPRFNTAVALEDGVSVSMITADSLCEYARQRPGMLLSVMRTLSAHTRELTEQYAELCRTIAQARENARRSEENSKGMKAKLARFVRDVVKSCFSSSTVNYDITGYMLGENQSADRRTYNSGSVVFCQGDPANCMYDVRKGSVGIYTDYGKMGEKQLATLKADDYFGEMGMIDEEPRSATCVVLEDETELEIITRASFTAYLQEKPLKVMMILQHMIKRLNMLISDYNEACKEVSDAENGRTDWLSDHFNKYIEKI